jgi:hypothetical protein
MCVKAVHIPGMMTVWSVGMLVALILAISWFDGVLSGVPAAAVLLGVNIASTMLFGLFAYRKRDQANLGKFALAATLFLVSVCAYSILLLVSAWYYIPHYVMAIPLALGLIVLAIWCDSCAAVRSCLSRCCFF